MTISERLNIPQNEHSVFNKLHDYLPNRELRSKIGSLLKTSWDGVVVWWVPMYLVSDFFGLQSADTPAEQSLGLIAFAICFTLGNVIAGWWSYARPVAELLPWKWLNGALVGLITATILIVTSYLTSVSQMWTFTGQLITAMLLLIGSISASLGAVARHYVPTLIQQIKLNPSQHVITLIDWVDQEFLFGAFPAQRQRLIELLGYSITLITLSAMFARTFSGSLISGILIGIGMFVGLYIIFYITDREDIIATQKRNEQIKNLNTVTIFTAHQINQPIGALRLMVSGAQYRRKRGRFKFDELDPLLADIMSQVDRLSKISRAVADVIEEDNRTVELNALITDVLDQHQGKGQVVFNRDLAPTIPTFISKPIVIREVLDHLLYNAEDALAEHPTPTITVSSWQKNGHLGFSVIDNGPGVRPEFEQTLFLPFTSTKSTAQSQGLGLFASDKIVREALQGEIKYQRAPNGGAQFDVTLQNLTR